MTGSPQSITGIFAFIRTSNNHINKINMFEISPEKYITNEVNLIVVS